MSKEVEVVEGEVLPSLNKLLEQANHEHHLVEEALNTALTHVITCGEILTQMREHYDEFAGWMKYIDERFDGGHQVAANYMRIYEYRELVHDLPSVKAAMTRLRGMPALRRGGNRGHGKEVKDEARLLYASGMTKTEISDLFGVCYQTIANWVDPEVLRRHRARVRADSERRREKKRQEKLEAEKRKIERDAKRVGGSLARAYSLSNQLETPLAKAFREATNPEVKKDLEDAIALHHRMMDKVVKALGAS